MSEHVYGICDRCCNWFRQLVVVRCWYGCTHDQCPQCADQTRREAAERD